MSDIFSSSVRCNIANENTANIERKLCMCQARFVYAWLFLVCKSVCTKKCVHSSKEIVHVHFCVAFYRRTCEDIALI